MKAERKPDRLLKNIILLGMISCFADFSSEMVYPLIPLYLTTALGATPEIVGIIEGIAESLASLLKVFGGYLSDRYRRKKKLAFIGYASGVIYKLALLFAGSWGGVLFARVIDRIGKGIRTAPRDVMVAESSEGGKLGNSFGIHKALDMLGSAAGILAAFFIMKKTGASVHSYRIVFALSLIPIGAALCLFAFVKEKKDREEHCPRGAFWKKGEKLDKNLKLYLAVVTIFTLGNSSNTFLLLRAKNIGFGATGVIMLYFLYNIVASAFAIPMGKRSDRKGRKSVLVRGYLLFALVYMIFAFGRSQTAMITAFSLYGLYTAMMAGAERAFISEIAPSELKGTMLGFHGTLVGVALLPASIIAGVLWEKVGVYAPFVFGAALSLTAAVVLTVGLKEKRLD